mgnify:CR=1 FL=1
MGKKKVTSTDIARAAGVSQSTVSMVLNKKYNVSFSKETVEKVENAAKELGYVPPKRKTKKVPGRETFGDLLFQPYEPLLCHAASGNWSPGQKSRDSASLSAIPREI